MLCLYSASTVWWSLWLDAMQAGPNYLLPSTYGQGRVPLWLHTCRAVLPSGCTLAGLCSPLAAHLWGCVPLMPHTSRAVFPLCHALAGPCSPLSHAPAGSCFPYATCLQGRVSPDTTQSQGRAAQLPEQGEAFTYLFPSSGISKGIGFPQRKAGD